MLTSDMNWTKHSIVNKPKAKALLKKGATDPHFEFRIKPSGK